MQTSKRGAAAAGSSAAASMREEMRGLRAAAQVPQRGEIGHGGGGAWALIGTSGRDRAGELRCVVSSRDGNIVSVLLRNEFFHTHCSFYTSQARGSQRPIPLAQNLIGGAGGRRASPGRERETRHAALAHAGLPGEATTQPKHEVDGALLWKRERRDKTRQITKYVQEQVEGAR